LVHTEDSDALQCCFAGEIWVNDFWWQEEYEGSAQVLGKMWARTLARRALSSLLFKAASSLGTFPALRGNPALVML
jgi:hypothetical protein